MGRKRKENPEINYVETAKGRWYFAYNYYDSEFGKQKRLYAETREALEEKIRHMKEEEERKLAAYLPKTTLLKDWASYYFKSLVSKCPATDLKNLIRLFDTSVFGSEIDKDMTEITVEEMQDFYILLNNRYEIKNVIKADSALREIFKIAGEKGVQTFDYSEIPVPEKVVDNRFREVPSGYMPTPEEQKAILDYCLSHPTLGSLSWTIIFASFTGIKLTYTAKLLHKNFNLEEKTVDTGNGIVPLSDECVDWLKRIIVRKAAEITDISIPCCTYAPELESLTWEQATVKLLENPELMDSFVKNYLAQNPDSVMFVTRNNKPVAIANTQRILRNIAEKCNLPKGITSVSLHKAFIAKEVQDGKSLELMKKRYGYKNEADIAEIMAEYELRKLLD